MLCTSKFALKRLAPGEEGERRRRRRRRRRKSISLQVLTSSHH